VIRSMKLGPSDTIFVLDIAYGSFKKLAAFVAAQSGARLMTVSVPSSRLMCRGDVVDIVRESLPETGVTLAIFDHITSNTALVLPVAELTAVCKAKGARVLIDGAHALGTMGLDIPSIGADYYVSNLHKWLSGCKGTAILYVRRELQDEIVPAVISHGFGAGFSSGFIWDGCRDYSGVLIVPALLKFWEAVDLPACRSYCRDLLKRACAVLCEVGYP
jgi:isopenicillin-N epimerase